ALTLFRTDNSIVFDFSHIFFDGPWAMAVAEMMTNEASRHLHLREKMTNTLPATPPQLSLALKASPTLVKAARKYSRNSSQISAEEKLPITPIHEVRRILMSSTRPRIHITVNDILVLYRSFFNQIYQPSPAVIRSLERLQKQRDYKSLAQGVLQEFQERQSANPALLIPIEIG